MTCPCADCSPLEAQELRSAQPAPFHVLAVGMCKAVQPLPLSRSLLAPFANSVRVSIRAWLSQYGKTSLYHHGMDSGRELFGYVLERTERASWHRVTSIDRQRNRSQQP
jgi:hypothetical protein